jgi:hypothetical protein
MLLLLLLACAGPDDCDAMCAAAVDRFEGCLDERGLEWGESVGYADAVDYDNWCGTWTWEVRQTGATDQCTPKLAVFRDGDCDAYYAAWAG